MRLSCRDFEVSVLSDGQVLQPYSVERPDPSTVTAYVASKAGKTFTVHCRNESTWKVSANLIVDGHRVRKSHIDVWERKHFRGARVNDHLLVPLKFSNLELVDADDDPTLASESHQIGTIKLELYRTDGLVPGEPPSSRDFTDTLAFTNAPVSERSKKAGAHRVLLDANTNLKSKASWTHRRVIDKSGSPYVTFTFAYLPEDLMRARGIVSRHEMATPNIVGHKRLHNFAEGSGPSKAKRTRVSAGPSNSQDEDVKPDMKASAFIPGEVIDLTEQQSVAVKDEPRTYFALGEVIDLTED